ncbi:hypothetical protein F4777DRAFT_512459 [Nemania sp. FL0916]|nr:hypothetical protein F4777DRAFT_512459 [Nemania sp. FL0916]
MAPTSTSLTVAAAASILASGWAAGLGASFSMFSIPMIVNSGASSEVMVRQWQFMFYRGQMLVPTLGVINAINYFTVAYNLRSAGVEWRGFAAAGASTFFIIPYTLTFIAGVNQKLIAASESRDKALSDAAAQSLIAQWGDLNVLRVIVPMIGTGLALWNFCL